MKIIMLEDMVNLLYEKGELINKNLEIIECVKIRHCVGCCCIDCGQYYEDCVCSHNQWVKDLKGVTRDKQ